MRKLIFLLLLIVAVLNGMAQSTATSVKFNKLNRPALMLLVPYTEDIAEGAIIQKLKEIGYQPETSGALLWKKNTVDGYYYFRNVMLQELNAQPVDLYFKIDRKSKKDKQQAYIYMMMAKGEDNFVSSETEPTVYNAGNRFLNSFVDYSATYKMDVDIQTQEDALKSAEKKYNKLQTEESDLGNKIQKLQNDLKENRQQQENQLKVIESERKKLEELRTKKLNKI
jgi:hypothetical protein